MLKKRMKYIDFDNNEREEDFYFNLTKAELTQMELSKNGGFGTMIHKIISEQDHERLVEIFKDLVLKSVGEKSLDGKYFIKNQEVRDRFASTQAYSDLFMELATNAEAAAAFVNAIIPQDAQKGSPAPPNK